MLVAALAALALVTACAGPQSSTGAADANSALDVAEPPGQGAPPQAAEAAAPPSADPALDSLLLEADRTARLGRPDAGVTRIALLVPLTGEHAAAGAALLDGAQMALFEAGVEGIELVPYDTAGSPDGAAEAARAALADGTRLMLGPLLAPNVAAAGSQARASRVPMIAFSNSEQVAGDGVYLIGFTPGDQVGRIVEFALAQGRQRFALVAPRNAYGDAVARAYRRAVTEGGATLVRQTLIDPAAEDWSGAIRAFADYDSRAADLERERARLTQRGDEAARQALSRLEPLDTFGDPPYDTVLLAATDPVQLRTLAGLLAFYDVDQPAVRILGLELWDAFGRLGTEPSLVGAWYPRRPATERARYGERFTALYGEAPARISSLAYDAMALAALGSAQAGTAGLDRDLLANPYGFVGVDGLFRFDAQSHLARRGLDIVEITPDGTELIDAFPPSFPPPAGAAIN